MLAVNKKRLWLAIKEGRGWARTHSVLKRRREGWPNRQLASFSRIDRGERPRVKLHWVSKWNTCTMTDEQSRFSDHPEKRECRRQAGTECTAPALRVPMENFRTTRGIHVQKPEGRPRSSRLWSLYSRSKCEVLMHPRSVWVAALFLIVLRGNFLEVRLIAVTSALRLQGLLFAELIDIEELKTQRRRSQWCN